MGRPVQLSLAHRLISKTIILLRVKMRMIFNLKIGILCSISEKRERMMRLRYIRSNGSPIMAVGTLLRMPIVDLQRALSH